MPKPPPPGPVPMPWTPQDPVGPALDPALGGPLMVTPAGAGATSVATDALLAHAERLTRLRETLEEDVLLLARLPAAGATLLATAPPAARQSVHELQVAGTLVRAAARLADQTERDLRQAIERYGTTEHAQRRAATRLGEGLAVLLGPVIRNLVVLGLPAILLARGTGLVGSSQLDAVKQYLLDNPGLITSPAFVEAVRVTAMSADDGIGAALGMPPGAAAVLAGAAGFTGVQAGAAYVIGTARPLGLFRDGPVAVDRVSTTTESAGPRGAVERLGRVPEGEQVRIERYDAPGERARFVVYVGPTETFSPIGAEEPWDLTSNVGGVAGLSAASLRATEAAMLDAGIGSSDEVQFVGFSQGGLVAARLAASSEWNTSGLETYGAPTGNVTLRPGIDGMAIRNSDDFVPALAGPQLDHHLLQVERQAFAPGSAFPDDVAAPAHQRSAYVATATEVDRARSEAVREQIAAMDGFTREYTDRPGSSVTVMMYHAERGAAKGYAEGSRATSSGAAIP